jgi:glycerophosphoryl diester phosphodiesterase
VEIKASPGSEAETGRAVALALARDWPKNLPRPLISSFSADSLNAAAEAAPQIPRALLALKFPQDWRRRLEELDCRALHCLNRRITPLRVRALNEAGYAIRAFTVNNRWRGARLLGWGVQGLITNYPERMLSLVAASQRPQA